MDKITTEFARVYIDVAHIIRIETFPGSKIDLENSIDLMSIANNFSNGGGKLLLIDLRKNKHISTSARLFFEQTNASVKQKAKAILIESRIVCMIKNSLMRYDATYPVKVFTSELKAVKWLYSID